MYKIGINTTSLKSDSCDFGILRALQIFEVMPFFKNFYFIGSARHFMIGIK